MSHLKRLVVIGSSTGGPQAVASLFSRLPQLDASIVLVQHMPKYINMAFIERLNSCTETEVRIAEDGVPIQSGIAYVAPSNVHLTIINNSIVKLVDGEKVNSVCPSIDVAMQSLHERPRVDVVGIVLTGIGRDGARGISHIKRMGGITIAQDEETSAIYGMPQAAFATGDVDFVMTPEAISSKLVEIVGVLKSQNTRLPKGTCV